MFKRTLLEFFLKKRKKIKMSSSTVGRFPYTDPYWSQFMLLRQLNPRDPTQIVTQGPLEDGKEVTFGS